MDQHIRAFVNLTRVAVVGVSNSAYKYGPRVYHDLKARGYDVVPINPALATFDGQTAYPRLSAIPEPVEGAVIVIPPSEVPAVLRDAAEAGVRHVWLQPGAASQEAVELAGQLGLELVHDACVMVEARLAGKARL